MDSNAQPETNLPPPVTPVPPPIHHSPPPVIGSVAYGGTPPRRPSRGTGWKVFAVILLVLLVLSVLMNLRHLAGSALGGKLAGNHPAYGPRLDEVTIEESDSTNKIVVIPIVGIISGEALDHSDYNMVTVIKEELKRAEADKDVKAVVLKVNSPGGEVMAADEISKALIKFQDSGKPVIVSMGSLAASGGYYISAPCDWIVANDLTITGSIGVIMEGFNYRGLLDKIGVKPMVFKSGKFKDMLSGTKTAEETSPEETNMVQSLILETYGRFKEVVADGRHASYKANKGQMLSADWESLADGRILSGREAYKHGFVDELGDFDKAVERAKVIAHIKKTDSPQLIEYQPAFDLSNLFRLFGESHARSMKVDLGVDLPKVRAGYLYFLSPTYLQ